MGNILQTEIIESDNSDDEELDFSLLRGSKCESKLDALTMDSIMLNVGVNNIDIFNLKLDEEDQIELIYLLYSNCHDAYTDMLMISQRKPINVIKNWMLNNSINDEALKVKYVVEALAVIQNFNALNLLGYTKESLINYLPLQKNASVFIDRQKKYFYRMFEDMDKEMEMKFLKLVEEDMLSKNINFKEFNCLELYFTYFETIKYIEKSKYQNILKHLKVLELTVNYNDIEMMQNSPLNFDETENNPFQHYICENIETNRSMNRNEECYDMDYKNPGVCLILDNEQFYTEFDKKYKDIVLSKDKKIENRKGSHYDSNRLAKIFGNMGFKVLLHKNKTHAEIKTIVMDTCQNITAQQSSFFMIFLSHGEKGTVIASNSIPLNIEDIKLWIYQYPILNKKPKVLIFQCCQGERFHTDGYSTDNVASDIKNIPKNYGTDILELYSALPGFVSVRDEFSGTWMIQSLCEILEEHTSDHFMDICVNVQRKVRSKNWCRLKEDGKKEIIKMVCKCDSTFEKKLYLPCPK